jgi:cytochrome c peroxidase
MSNRRLSSCLTLALALTVTVFGLQACGDLEPQPDAEQTVEVTAELASRAAGRELFERPLPGTNGRSCATCHVLDDESVLKPANVEARLAANPRDPLFNRLDADDPGAAVPSYEHLRKGLVRVVLPLPPNMDVIDEHGQVVTPADRNIAVWRAVPSVKDTAMTRPFLFDGRASTLEAQAQSALRDHSESGPVSARALGQIAGFERSLFTSPRARYVSTLLELRVPLDQIPIPERFMPLTTQERRGREVYERTCSACHGGPVTNQIVNRAIHDSLFFELTREGNIRYRKGEPGKPPSPILAPRPHNESLNIGAALLSYLGQRGVLPMYNASVELPRYRFRFYSDGTRRQQVTDLPPIPVTLSGDPSDVTPGIDPVEGTPIVGPSLAPQWYSTDPGRALITGDWADFEGFDPPSLRGVAGTAPYFHDNSHETLKDVVDSYSRFILPFFPDLKLPMLPPELPGGPAEGLSPAEKADLLTFLNRL